jgi:hypothetical protein
MNWIWRAPVPSMGCLNPVILNQIRAEHRIDLGNGHSIEQVDLYVIFNEGTQFTCIAAANPPQVRET